MKFCWPIGNGQGKRKCYFFRWSLIIVLSREECCSNLAKVKFACCNYEFSNHYVLITLRFHSIFRKCFPSVAAPGIWFSFRSVAFFFFWLHSKHETNLHLTFIDIFAFLLIVLICISISFQFEFRSCCGWLYLQIKRRPFAFICAALLFFFFFVISVFVYLHFYFIFFFCICILFLRRHKLVAATSRWVQQKHTHLPYL